LECGRARHSLNQSSVRPVARILSGRC
jgi:hypothetical protein